MAYAFQNDEKKEQLAYARVDGVNASYRDLCNVCSNIKGRRADKAIVYLEEALEKKRPIRYFRHNKRRGHLHQLGGRKGGYPIKSILIVLNVLKNAVANADAKGLADCKVIHTCANKGVVYARMSAKGRRIRQDFETAFVEVVLRELQTEENLAKKQKIQKARLEKKKKEEEAAKKAAEDKKQKETQKPEQKDTQKPQASKDKPAAEVSTQKPQSKTEDEEKQKPKVEDSKPVNRDEKSKSPKVDEAKSDKKEQSSSDKKSGEKPAKKKMSEVIAQNKKEAKSPKN